MNKDPNRDVRVFCFWRYFINYPTYTSPWHKAELCGR